MRRLPLPLILATTLLPMCGGCQTAARCGLWLMEAWEPSDDFPESEYDRYQAEQKRQVELGELYRQIDEEDRMQADE